MKRQRGIDTKTCRRSQIYRHRYILVHAHTETDSQTKKRHINKPMEQKLGLLQKDQRAKHRETQTQTDIKTHTQTNRHRLRQRHIHRISQATWSTPITFLFQARFGYFAIIKQQKQHK